jgi:HEAT repeat protein
MLKFSRKFSPLFIFPLTLLLVIFLAAPWVSAKEAEKEKPIPQPWEIKGIVAALNDPYAGVRLAAADKLGEYKLDNPKSLIDASNKGNNQESYNKLVQQLREQLSSTDKDEQEKNTSRQAAASALGNMQAKEIAKDVALLLKNSDTSIRDSAASALGNMQAKEFAKDVALLLKNSDTSIRNSAASALGNMQAKEFAKEVFLLLKDSNSDVRSSAASALGNMQAKEFAKDVALLLKDSDEQVRRSAAEALGNMQAKEVAKDVALLLKDSDEQVRRSAAEALGNMQAKEYAKNVVLLLKDNDTIIRIFAAKALGDMQAKEIAKDVVLLLKDNDKYVRSSAVSALGGMQVKEFAKDVALLLKDSDEQVRRSTAQALENMQAKEIAKDVALLLKDSDNQVRSSAASALGNMQAKEYAKDVVLLLKDSDTFVRSSAASALPKLGKQDLPRITQILEAVLRSYPEEKATPRFLAHFLSGGEPNIQILLQWVGSPKTIPDKPSYEDGKKALEIFDKTWKILNESTPPTPQLRQELAEAIAKVVGFKIWKAGDINLLQSHYNNLKGYTQAEVVKSAIQDLEYWKWIFAAKDTILIHITFWLALIFAYPKSPQVQAIFFWNPWVRRILGMGYVGFLLTWVPFFRRKLLEPFKFSLLADAGLDNFNPAGYFPNSGVLETGVLETKVNYPLSQAIPSINGQIILEGDSGLGKSMFLRHLLKTSPRTIVYLPAQKCDKGIIEAIQIKLHGQAQDAEFLKNLIYSGAIDICIDGLNEVTADTRAKICQFVESYFRGNIIMTTQPLEWTPPKTAKIYYLQTLTAQQIEDFLISRTPLLPQDAKLKGFDYEKACKTYLAQTLNSQQSSEELAASLRILSNPMDLTLVSLMMAQANYPNLFNLQEQQYKLMAEEYLREWKHDFPLKKFAATVYELRLNDQQALPSEEFHQELLSMEDEKYKMVVSRQWQDNNAEAKKEWFFRHDKIMEFFLVQNFLGNSDEIDIRLKDHMGDPRFRGVYFLLGLLLPVDAAKELRERLIQYAADTKDHTVSDTFVQLLRTR